ncbi:glycosyltransferase family 4 protein [[Clostridium] aminophilum]|uniref:Glycosyl transferases group 1 n=1 Tax=[Clostridium] aminophilum TaxID=1526 RepID=A0A1I6IVC1_9FIRM|nr:glycosyltransferase family 4 protein [[Clostridium] aminophilum]SFR70657.1 Glycosyl transferases group 1 [[Clostridium] aminophilum]
MKQILHITAHLGGGAGKAISGLIEGCREYQNSVIMLEEPADRHWCEVCENAGAGIVIAPSEEEMICAIENADVVILDWWAHPLMVGLLSLLDRVSARYVLWSHVNGLSFPVLKPEFLNEFDSVLFTSPCSFERIRENAGIAEELLKRAELVYGMGNFQPQRAPYKKDYSGGDRIHIGYIGTLDLAKMSPDYPEVCALIHEMLPNAEFHFYGRYTEDFEREFFSEKEIREYVALDGFEPDPGSRYPTFDIFLYLLTKKNYATTENSILEAMAAGLPVVVYDNPPEKAIIKNGVTGIVAGSRKEAAEAIKRLWFREEERKRLGTAARAFVIENYHANANAKRFQNAIGRILNQEKHLHHFEEIVGKSLWERFLYICGDDRKNAEELAAGKNGRIPDCFKSESKSSPAHFLKYYDDRNLTALAERICAEDLTDRRPK